MSRWSHMREMVRRVEEKAEDVKVSAKMNSESDLVAIGLDVADLATAVAALASVVGRMLEEREKR